MDGILKPCLPLPALLNGMAAHSAPSLVGPIAAAAGAGRSQGSSSRASSSCGSHGEPSRTSTCGSTCEGSRPIGLPSPSAPGTCRSLLERSTAHGGSSPCTTSQDLDGTSQLGSGDSLALALTSKAKRPRPTLPAKQQRQRRLCAAGDAQLTHIGCRWLPRLPGSAGALQRALQSLLALCAVRPFLERLALEHAAIAHLEASGGPLAALLRIASLEQQLARQAAPALAPAPAHAEPQQPAAQLARSLSATQLERRLEALRSELEEAQAAAERAQAAASAEAAARCETERALAEAVRERDLFKALHDEDQPDVMLGLIHASAGELALRANLGNGTPIGERVHIDWPIEPAGCRPRQAGAWQMAQGHLPDGRRVFVKRCLFNPNGTPRPAGLPPGAPWSSFSDVMREPRAALGLSQVVRRRGGAAGGQGMPFVNPLLRMSIRRTSRTERSRHGFLYEMTLLYKWLPRGDLYASHYEVPMGLQAPHTLPELQRVLLQLLDGFDALHGAGLLLGDGKADNFGLDEQGNVVFFDLGGLIELLPGANRAERVVEYTESYASPEQLRRAGCFTCKASDLYTWARTAQCLLHPWHRLGGNLALPAVQQLLQLVTDCLLEDPAGRPSAARAYERLAAIRF